MTRRSKVGTPVGRKPEAKASDKAPEALPNPTLAHYIEVKAANPDIQGDCMNL